MGPGSKIKGASTKKLFSGFETRQKTLDLSKKLIRFINAKVYGESFEKNSLKNTYIP